MELARSQMLTSTQPALTAGTALPEYRGRISVTSARRYFHDEDGQGFLVIGQHDSVTGPGLSALFERNDSEAVEQYVRSLRAHGVTVSSISLGAAGQAASVDPFPPAVVRFWDAFLSLAEQYGLYLLLALADTLPQSGQLAEPATLAAHRSRWDFVVRRWGGWPNIFAWNLMPGIDLCPDATPEEIAAYLTEMAAYVRGLEREVWGSTHLLTASTASAPAASAAAEVVHNHPALDFATGQFSRDPLSAARLDAETAVVETERLVHTARAALRAPRPFFESEGGPGEDWTEVAGLAARLHHHRVWAHFAAGGAGSGVRWPYTRSRRPILSMQDDLLGLARFAASVPWAHFDSRSATGKVSLSRPGFFHAACADRFMAILWLARDTRLVDPPPLDSLIVEMHGVLANGIASIQLWDTIEGTWLDSLWSVSTRHRFTFVLPGFNRPLDDLAILIRLV